MIKRTTPTVANGIMRPKVSVTGGRVNECGSLYAVAASSAPRSLIS
jgi:hypothetical protein